MKKLFWILVLACLGIAKIVREAIAALVVILFLLLSSCIYRESTRLPGRIEVDPKTGEWHAVKTYRFAYEPDAVFVHRCDDPSDLWHYDHRCWRITSDATGDHFVAINK